MEEAMGPNLIRSCSEFTNFRRKTTVIVPMIFRCFFFITCFVSESLLTIPWSDRRLILHNNFYITSTVSYETSPEVKYENNNDNNNNTWVITKSLSQSLRRLNLHLNTHTQMQKSLILGTCSIVRNFLNYK